MSRIRTSFTCASCGQQEPLSYRRRLNGRSVCGFCYGMYARDNRRRVRSIRNKKRKRKSLARQITGF